MESLKLLPPPMRKEKGEKVARETGITFRARVRYLACSQIITIPKKVSRELGLRLGDTIYVEIKRT